MDGYWIATAKETQTEVIYYHFDLDKEEIIKIKSEK